MTATEAIRAPAVDSLFEDWTGERPGGAVAVLRGQDVLHCAAYGLANLESGELFRTNHRFTIASVTKHMTALCILLLQRQGLLSLEDEVDRRFPGMLKVDAPITISHLCANTSGLRDYITLATYAGGRLITKLRKPMIRRLVSEQASLNFPPGDQYSYSNSNFVVLSWIIEETLGIPLQEAFARLLFRPLGMHDTFVVSDSNDTPERAARGYAGLLPGSFKPWHWDMDMAGEGGVWSTLDDLVKWLRNFNQPRVGDASVFAQLGEPQTLNSGAVSEYALGLHRGATCGRPWLGHSGGWEGYRSFLLYFPEDELGVVALANHTADIQAAALEAAQCFLSTPLDHMCGDYYSEELGATLTGRVEHGQLRLSVDGPAGRLSALQLCRVAEQEFRLSRAARQRWNLEFDTAIRFASASPARLTLSSDLAREVHFLKL
jgi:CubicO group peptidase (beta-lactamase class C family)